MQGLDPLEVRVRDVLAGVPALARADGGWSRGRWTREIKTRLCAVAHELGFKVQASGCDGSEWGEWLYDMVWLRHDQTTRDVGLVLESEWNFEDLGADFEKLLVARADHRVMIFENRSTSAVRKNMQDFVE